MKFLLLIIVTLSLIAHTSSVSNNHHHHFLSRFEHSRLAHRARAKQASHHCGISCRRTKNFKISHSPVQLWNNIGVSDAKITRLLNIKSDCGDIGATKEITASSGPNGSEDWLNCGINDGGWRPPNVKVHDLVAEELSQAIQSPNSPFKACTPFVPLFEKYGQKYGIPPIIFAALALEESSCHPDTTGAAGEQGLMQITKDKCSGAPGGNCKDPDFNIGVGSEYFATTLASNGGNIIKTIGMYNGWKPGMTHAQATAAGLGSCCRCQNNLDYIHQFVNGWLLNKDAYAGNPRLGIYFNLDKCGH